MGLRHLLVPAVLLAMPVLSIAANSGNVPPAPAGQEALPGVKMAEAVSATTGMAISPLLGVSAVGAWRYWQTPPEARGNVPWFAHPWFWGPALFLVLLLAAKEPLLYFFPGAKKPLDLVEVVENKASALLAAPVVLQMAIAVFQSAAEAGRATTPVVTAGFDPGVWFGAVAAGVGLLLVFACVWLVAHTVNILILLSPSATLDMILRGSRTLVMAAVGLSSCLNVWFGLAVSLLVLLLAVRCFGWAWRLTFYGTTVAVDWLGFRRDPPIDPAQGVRAFTARAAGRLPVRSRGVLRMAVTGEPEFRGRALPWLPARVVPVQAVGTVVARSFPGVHVRVGGGNRTVRAFVLPPRFRGREEALGRAFGIEADLENPIARTLRAAWSWLMETVAASANTQVLDDGRGVS